MTPPSLPTNCPTCGAPLEVTVDAPHACPPDLVKVAKVDLSLQEKSAKIKDVNEKIAQHLLDTPPPP